MKRLSALQSRPQRTYDSDLESIENPRYPKSDDDEKVKTAPRQSVEPERDIGVNDGGRGGRLLHSDASKVCRRLRCLPQRRRVQPARQRCWGQSVSTAGRLWCVWAGVRLTGGCAKVPACSEPRKFGRAKSFPGPAARNKSGVAARLSSIGRRWAIACALQGRRKERTAYVTSRLSN